ncbi:MAG: Ig-like domain-containing protein, partial [Coriobacteriia bacterium]|nr:Ig-like domain-containing protein [Coriobacteriia bacterium]
MKRSLKIATVALCLFMVLQLISVGAAVANNAGSANNTSTTSASKEATQTGPTAQSAETTAGAANPSATQPTGKAATTAPQTTASAPSSSFFMIPQYSGKQQLTATGTGSPVWSSSDDTIATVDTSGMVRAQAEGNAIITASFSDRTSSEYYVSVYYAYPQPKTAQIYLSADGKPLCLWGMSGNTDYTGDVLTGAETVTLLYRAQQGGVLAATMQ